MKSLPGKRISMLLTVASLGGAIVVTSLAATPTTSGNSTTPTKRSTVQAGQSAGARAIAKTPAQKAQERKIVGTLRQMGFNVTGITRTANGQYSVQVNRFNPANAAGAFRGVVSFRRNAATAGRNLGPARFNQRGNAANMPEQIGTNEIGGPAGGPTGGNSGGGTAGGGDGDSIVTPGGGSAGGPFGGGIDGATGGGNDGGGGLGDDGFGDGGGLGPDGGGIGPDGGGDGPDGGGTGPDGGGIGPDGGDGGGGEGGPGGGTGGSGEEGPPTPGGDGGGGDPDGGNDPDGGTGPDDGGDSGGGGEEGPPSDPDGGGDERVLGRGASRDFSRTNNQTANRGGMLATGRTTTLRVSVSSRGVLAISRRSLAQAGLINHTPSAANGNVVFH